MRQLCVRRDMKHAGSLESTKEARVALATPRATLKAYLHGTTLSHATSLRQAYDMT